MTGTSAKIVHLIGQLGRGGAEKQLFLLATALHKRGWRQCVISLAHDGLWKPRLQDAGVPVLEVPRHRFKLWRLWQLRRLVRQQEPQILVSWSSHTAIYAQWLRGIGQVRRIANVRLDPTIDSNSGERIGRLEWYRSAIEKADHVVSNVQWSLQALQQAGVKMPPCDVIRNIVAAPGRARPTEPAAVPRIAAVGSLNSRKAYDVLVRALALLSANGKKFELLVAGSGPEKKNLMQLAAQLNVAEQIKFLGDVDDVPALLATAHLLVHPSKCEGLSNSIIEAMAEGLPVIASPAGGNPEIVADGQTGILVPAGQPDLLATSIQRLLDDPDLRGQLGKQGLLAVREHCSEAQVVEQYEKIFQHLLLNR